MKHKTGDDWYPFWIDKWLFGSTKFEFTPAERSVWIDLLTLAHKDKGFIRANENMPYPPEHLANLFVVPIDLLQTTIKKSIENGKLQQLEDGSMFVISYEKYELTKRHKRRLEKSRVEKSRGEGVRKTDTVSDKEDIDSIYTSEFEEFWAIYPKKVGKGEAFRSWRKLNPNTLMRGRIKSTVEQQKASPDWRKENGQFIPHPATWLNQRRFDDTGIVKPKENVIICCICPKPATMKQNTDKGLLGWCSPEHYNEWLEKQ